MNGETTTVDAVDVPSEKHARLLKTDDPHQSCALCKLNVPVKYDVSIISC